MRVPLLVFERNMKPFRSFCDRKMVLGQMFNDTSSSSTNYTRSIHSYFLEALDVRRWGPVTDGPRWCLRSSECQSSETSRDIVGVWWFIKGDRYDRGAEVRFGW